jgi:parallel beta-helix repeat protein
MPTTAFFVATNGSDANDGSIDRPFATLAHAQAAMEVSGAPQTTYVRAGSYTLTQALDLGVKDSGQTWAAYQGEKVVISGAEHIEGSAFTSDGNGRYSAATYQTSLDLVLDGQHQTAARNVAYDANDTTTGWHVGTPTNNGQTIQFKAGDLTPAQLTPGTVVEAYSDIRWANVIATVTSVDWQNNTFTVSENVPYTDVNPGSKVTWRLEGGASSVDQTGEFGWDDARGRVVIKPADAAALVQNGADIARLGTLVHVSGSNITVQGFHFENTIYNGPAVYLDGATKSKVTGNHFDNVGIAVQIDNGVTNTVADNVVRFTGSDAIDVRYGSGNLVSHNTIEQADQIKVGGGAISLNSAQNSVVDGNYIHDATRYGIALTKWGDTLPIGNTISNNVVLHTSTQTSDTGAIEFWANHDNTNSKTLITGNYVDDVGGLISDSNTGELSKATDAHDIYLDDAASGVTIRNNVLGTTDSSDIFLHGGSNINIDNNIAIVKPASSLFRDNDGTVSPGGSGIYFERTLEVKVGASDFPTGSSKLVVRAKADLAQNIGAHFVVLVDGVNVGGATAGANFADFTFTVPATAGKPHTIGIKFDNDLSINGEDRNLYVRSLTVNGDEIKIEGSGVAVRFQPTTGTTGQPLTASNIDVTHNIVVTDPKATVNAGLPNDYVDIYDNLNPYDVIDYNLLSGVKGTAGKDVHSATGDPRFIDPANGNYNLKPGSPALGLGYTDPQFKFDAVTGGALNYANAAGGVDVRLADHIAYRGPQGQSALAPLSSATAGATRFFEAVNIIGSTFGDRLTGNDASNILNGGTGADVMRGGKGGDTYIVDNVGDVTDEVKGGGGTGDYVKASVSFTAASGIERLYLTGSSAINATGHVGQNDILVGNAGNNILNGLAGADLMRGGLGNDTYYVDNTGDTTDEVNSGGGVADYVYSSVSFMAAAGIERLYLTGTAANGTGRDGQNDIITGNARANTLSGLSGNDVLVGGLGSDTLNGGTGQDIFRFDTKPNAATNMDTIIGFVAVDDTIQLENAIFTALTTTGALTAGAFNTGTAATQADDRIIYNTTTGALLYDADGLGGAAAVQFALLSAHPALSAADFFVI